MVKILNDGDEPIRAVIRNLQGQDGEIVTIESGEVFEGPIDGNNNLIIMSGPTATAAAQPGALTKLEAPEDEAELSDPTDDDIRAAAATIDALPTAATHKTEKGQYKVDSLNDALEAAGFKPINAERRNALWPLA